MARSDDWNYNMERVTDSLQWFGPKALYNPIDRLRRRPRILEFRNSALPD